MLRAERSAVHGSCASQHAMSLCCPPSPLPLGVPHAHPSRVTAMASVLESTRHEWHVWPHRYDSAMRQMMGLACCSSDAHALCAGCCKSPACSRRPRQRSLQRAACRCARAECCHQQHCPMLALRTTLPPHRAAVPPAGGPPSMPRWQGARCGVRAVVAVGVWGRPAHCRTAPPRGHWAVAGLLSAGRCKGRTSCPAQCRRGKCRRGKCRRCTTRARMTRMTREFAWARREMTAPVDLFIGTGGCKSVGISIAQTAARMPA